MLKQETYICKNGKRQIHTYSDSGYYILQVETNIEYSEAYDNEPLLYTYKETNKKIEVLEDD